MKPESDPHAAWLERASLLPRPVLREEAHLSSLAAALAALEDPSTLTTLNHVRYRRFINIHTVGWAACWLAIGLFQLQSPPRTPSASRGPVATWPPLPQDPEMARLMASLYPHRAKSAAIPTSTRDSLWLPQP